jgi:hypothetical protein
MSEAPPKFDVFLSCPMAGTRTGKQYEELRALALTVARCLEQDCGLTVFFAGRHAETREGFDEPDFSLVEDMAALKRSTYFLLLYPERLVSSVLVEAGMAVALDKKAVYFVRDVRHLPFMLRHLNRVCPVKVYEYKTVDRIVKLLRDHKVQLFEPWAGQLGQPAGDPLATRDAAGGRPLEALTGWAPSPCCACWARGSAGSSGSPRGAPPWPRRRSPSNSPARRGWT